MQNNQYEINNIDAEIFMRPSQQLIAKRFQQTDENAAQCSGICHSGSCNTLVDTAGSVASN